MLAFLGILLVSAFLRCSPDCGPLFVGTGYDKRILSGLWWLVLRTKNGVL